MRILSNFILCTLLFSSSSIIAGELDTYYLDQFGELSDNRALAKSSQQISLRKCGMPLKRSLKNDWKQLEESTQNTLAKYLALPDTTGMTSVTSPNGNFIIWYFPSGSDAPTPIAPYDLSGWVQTVAATFDYVYTQEVMAMGYSPPLTRPYPVYLKQLASQGYFGVTDSDIVTGQTATSYITIDNDFRDTIYHPYTGLPALQITAAHEFHHAIQFSYNFYFEPWYAEATSSWIEDEVYDPVNQSYVYLGTYLANTASSLNSGNGYDRWIFNRLLAENHTTGIIRSIWDRLRLTDVPDRVPSSYEVPTLPIINAALIEQQSSLSNELISLARRLYTKEWTTHIGEIPLIYSTPLNIMATYSSYPVNSATLPAPSATLPGNSFVYFKFIPTPSITDLQITVSRTSGIQLALLKKTGTAFTEIPVDANGTSFTVSGFGTMNPSTDEVVLVIANTTSTNNHTASFSTDGSTTPLPEPTTPEGGGGGGGGCFIATAAYGSYLHPDVMTLRKFRDTYLITNLPGRAFVTVYYKISPPIADFIREHQSVRFTARIVLTPVIFAVKHLWAAAATAAILALIGLLRTRKSMRCA